MSIVYAPQVPVRYDQLTGKRLSIFNLNTALRFGNLVELLPAEADLDESVEKQVQLLQEGLFDFARDDVLMAIGDPIIIAAAAAIVCKKMEGRMRMLKWDKRAKEYFLVEFRINDQ